MAGAGKKTFTAGEVLTASDVNTYLMEQSVMVFGGTAARSSAIPTPSTGMTTYIGTTGTATIPQIEVYTGSQFQTPYGLTLVSSTSFAASSITVQNVFTSAYQNYQIVLSLTSGGTGNTDVNFQLALAGTTSTSGYRYSGVGAQSGGTTDNVSTGTNASALPITQTTATTNISASFFVGQPQTATFTSFTSDLTYDDGGIGIGRRIIGRHRVATAYDGFTISNAGAITGTVRVYGYRNA